MIISTDQNDHLIFFLGNSKIARKVKKELDKKNHNWYFANSHKMALRRLLETYMKEDKRYKKYLNINYWKNAWSLLQRSISPISIKSTEKNKKRSLETLN